MLDKLIEIGKQQLGGQLKQEVDFNDEQVDKTMYVAKDSITDGLKEQVLNGNVSGVMNLFNGKSSATTSNPIVSGIVDKFAANLMTKLGVGPGTAQKVTQMVIPFLMSKFSSPSETGEAKDESSLMSMIGLDKDNAISSFLGKKGGDLLGGLFG